MDDKIEKEIKELEDKLKMPYSFVNTPNVVANFIRPMIQDKIVCDIGCMVGVFMDSLKKYAKEVIGVEVEEREYNIAKKRGHNVIFGDGARIELPKADVYYVWVHKDMFIPIIENIKNGLIITGAYWPYPELQEYLNKMGAITIEIPDLINEFGSKHFFQINILRK